jgi:large subunit ribosomal protein L10
MPTEAKAQIIRETAELLAGAEGVVLASYTKLSVPQFNRLRRDLKQNGVTLKVVKNTLLKRAADEAGITGLDPYLEGPTVLAVSPEDPVAPAKLVQAATREFRTLEIKAGVLGKDAITPAETRALAALPGRQQLLGQVAGTMAAPVQRLAWVLNAPLAQLARVVDAVRQQREAAEGA